MFLITEQMAGISKIKAKIKASAWKTIRKTQYDNYEDY